ncbi:hypothetical protein O3P69_014663 [Scylla paramamosain]|uniref:Cyclin-like domain-containing protein n=1 Tax=Scylla paramamosain TaxID=85552 RepID=A0AAW0TYX8_SCYPA
MGSMPGGGAVGVWVGGDRLRPTHLRATLTRLREKERRDWQPCILQPQDSRQPQQQERDEVGVAGRDGAVWWQGEACGALGWGYETKFGAAAILDQMLQRVRVPARYLHAVAAAAVFLSAKVNEEDENVPSTEEVVWRGQMRCSARELLRMERVLLDKLSWCLPPTTVLDFLQVLHALAIVTAPKHHHHHRHQQCQSQRYQCRHALRGEDSPTHQLEALTVRLWHVVGCGESGALRPSLLALALLSLELEAATPEPGLTPWLQALTQVSEEELVEAQGRVRRFLGEVVDSYRTSALTLPPSLLLPSPVPPETVPPSRPNKRKVERCAASEEDAYMDIKKLYAHGKTHTTTTTTTTTSPKHKTSQIEQDDLYTDIRRLYSSPPPFHPCDTPSPTPPLLPGDCRQVPGGWQQAGSECQEEEEEEEEGDPVFQGQDCSEEFSEASLEDPLQNITYCHQEDI